MHVIQNGSVTARDEADDRHFPGTFHIITVSAGITHNEVMLHSVQYNDSYLHFAEIEYNSSGGYNMPHFGLYILPIFGEYNTGNIIHYVWVEERISQNLMQYSVTLNDSTVCYLAFEIDGTPVENPCQDKETLGLRAQFFVFTAF